MAGPGEWGMQRPSGSPVAGPGHLGMGRAGPMGGPMMNRSNSVPGNTRSMLHQQLMEMGMSHIVSVEVYEATNSEGFYLLLPDMMK